MLNRRAFVCGMISTVLAVPLVAEAQQASKAPSLGMLLTGSPSSGVSLPELDAFMKQLAALGWVDGQTLTVERRWGEPDRLAELAADLIRQGVGVILTPGPSATAAARAVTSTTPIVMVASSDPRVFGITSLARPAAI